MLKTAHVTAGNSINQAGNALIVLSSTGTLTFTFNDGSILSDVIPGDSFDFSIPGSYGQKSQIDHYEYFKVDSSVTGDNIVLQIGWGKKYNVAVPGVGPAPAVEVRQVFGAVMDDSIHQDIAPGAASSVGGWNQANTLAIIVSSAPQNVGTVWIMNPPTSNLQRQGIPLAPGQSVTLPGDFDNGSNQGEVNIYNPNSIACFITVVAFEVP